MMLAELKRCRGHLLVLCLSMMAIPLGARWFPRLNVDVNGGERHVVSAFVLLSGFVVLMVLHSMAVQLFRAERLNGSLEYLLTLPAGKWNLLARKMGMRLLIVLPFWLAFVLLSQSHLRDAALDGYLFPLNHPVFMHVTLVFMLGSGFLMALHEQRNWGAIVSFLLLYDLVLITLAITRVSQYFGFFEGRMLLRNGLGYGGAVLVCLVMLLCPFLANVRRFDLRSFDNESVLRKMTVPLLAGGMVCAIAVLILL